MRRSHNGRESPCIRQDGSPKRKCTSRRQAEGHAEYIAKVNRTGAPLGVYPCPVCHFWHVGKPGRRKNTERGGWS